VAKNDDTLKKYVKNSAFGRFLEKSVAKNDDTLNDF